MEKCPQKHLHAPLPDIGCPATNVQAWRVVDCELLSLTDTASVARAELMHPVHDDGKRRPPVAEGRGRCRAHLQATPTQRVCVCTVGGESLLTRRPATRSGGCARGMILAPTADECCAIAPQSNPRYKVAQQLRVRQYALKSKSSEHYCAQRQAWRRRKIRTSTVRKTHSVHK